MADYGDSANGRVYEQLERTLKEHINLVRDDIKALTTEQKEANEAIVRLQERKADKDDLNKLRADQNWSKGMGAGGLAAGVAGIGAWLQNIFSHGG